MYYVHKSTFKYDVNLSKIYFHYFFFFQTCIFSHEYIRVSIYTHIFYIYISIYFKSMYIFTYTLGKTCFYGYTSAKTNEMYFSVWIFLYLSLLWSLICFPLLFKNASVYLVLRMCRKQWRQMQTCHCVSNNIHRHIYWSIPVNLYATWHVKSYLFAYLHNQQCVEMVMQTKKERGFHVDVISGANLVRRYR